MNQPLRGGERQRAPKPWLQVGTPKPLPNSRWELPNSGSRWELPNSRWDCFETGAVQCLCFVLPTQPQPHFAETKDSLEGGFVTWTPRPVQVLAFPKKIPSLLTSSCAQFFLLPSFSRFSNSQMPECLGRLAQPRPCGCLGVPVLGKHHKAGPKAMNCRS